MSSKFNDKAVADPLRVFDSGRDCKDHTFGLDGLCESRAEEFVVGPFSPTTSKIIQTAAHRVLITYRFNCHASQAFVANIQVFDNAGASKNDVILPIVEDVSRTLTSTVTYEGTKVKAFVDLSNTIQVMPGCIFEITSVLALPNLKLVGAYAHELIEQRNAVEKAISRLNVTSNDMESLQVLKRIKGDFVNRILKIEEEVFSEKLEEKISARDSISQDVAYIYGINIAQNDFELDSYNDFISDFKLLHFEENNVLDLDLSKYKFSSQSARKNALCQIIQDATIECKSTDFETEVCSNKIIQARNLLRSDTSDALDSKIRDIQIFLEGEYKRISDKSLEIIKEIETLASKLKGILR